MVRRCGLRGELDAHAAVEAVTHFRSVPPLAGEFAFFVPHP